MKSEHTSKITKRCLAVLFVVLTSVAMLAQTHIVGWGGNDFGQLGNGNTTISGIPIDVDSSSNFVAAAVGLSHSLFLKNDGTVWACGDNRFGSLGDGTSTSLDINDDDPSNVEGGFYWYMVVGFNSSGEGPAGVDSNNNPITLYASDFCQ